MSGPAHGRSRLVDQVPAGRSQEPPAGFSVESGPLAFDEIYDQWFDAVARWIGALGGPTAERDDLAQDVFIVVHRRLPHFDGRNLPGWLYQIARNRVRDYRRSAAIKHIFSRAIPLLGNYESVDPSPSPEESLETREKRDLLKLLLDELPDAERSAVVLFEIEGYSGEQIAALQNVPINTIWARIHKARLKLHRKLARGTRRAQLFRLDP